MGDETMTEQEVFERNLTLSIEFSRYLLEHPGFAASLPSQAHVVLLPKDDPELYAINLKGVQVHQERGEENPVVFVEAEGLIPVRSRLLRPRVAPRPTLMPALA